MSADEVRVLAHHVVWNGSVHTMAVARVFADDGGLWHVEVRPFERETQATTFHSGTVTIEGRDGSAERPVVLFS
ncbi:MAG: hypothetical protein K2K22_06745 [Muribaculaceae bacterium]|nr:hypothetical protein [Muribaculaceae bacterium]